MDGRYLNDAKQENKVVKLRGRLNKPKRGQQPSALSINMDITIPQSMSAEFETQKRKHVVFVLDKSGSMGPDEHQPFETSNLYLVKKAIIDCVNGKTLADDDLLSITFFDTQGELVVDHCRVDDFRKPYSAQRIRFDLVKKCDGCTLIQSGFAAIKKNQRDADYMNIVVLLTDGKDFQGKRLEAANKTQFTNADDVLKDLHDKFGDSLHSVTPILFGADPSAMLASQLSTKSKGNLILHIKSSADIGPKMHTFGTVIGKAAEGKFKLHIKIGQYETTLDDFGNALPGYEYQRSLSIPLSAIGMAVPESEIQENAVITYTHNDHIETQTLVFALRPPVLTSSADAGQAFYEDLEVTARAYCEEVKNSHLYTHRMLGPDGKLRRITPMGALSENELTALGDIFTDLLQYHDQLAQQGELECTQILNELHGLMRECAYFYQGNLYIVGTKNFNFDPSALRVKAIGNDMSTNSANKVKLPKQMLALVDLNAPEGAGARTAGAYACLRSVKPGMVGMHEGRAFIRIERDDYQGRAAKENPSFNTSNAFKDYKVVDGTFDFSQYSSRNYGICSLDGGLVNREVILVSTDSYFQYELLAQNLNLNMQPLLPKTEPVSLLDRLRIRTQILQELLVNPKDDSNIDLLLASFYNQDTITLSDGKEIPAVELQNFLIERQGYCRHQALTNALTLGYAVADKKMPAGEVTIYRSTAYDQRAHAMVLYRTLDDNKQPALYLIDTTLKGSVPYNLFDPIELEAALVTYNELGLNGVLNDLIRRENLELDNKDLLKVGLLNRALLEEFDEDDDFVPFRCPIENVTPSDPVRLVHKHAKGEEELSTEIYEREAIEIWMARMKGKNPAAPVLSPFSNREICDVVEAGDAKQAILKLIQDKKQFFKPEEAVTGVLLNQESSSRKQRRTENREGNFTKWSLLCDSAVETEKPLPTALSAPVKSTLAGTAGKAPGREQQSSFVSVSALLGSSSGANALFNRASVSADESVTNPVNKTPTESKPVVRPTQTGHTLYRRPVQTPTKKENSVISFLLGKFS